MPGTKHPRRTTSPDVFGATEMHRRLQAAGCSCSFHQVDRAITACEKSYAISIRRLGNARVFSEADMAPIRRRLDEVARLLPETAPVAEAAPAA